MKKYLSLLVLPVLLIVCMGMSASAVTMYAPDGRTVESSEQDVASWQNFGWYTVPVSTIYAPDGRSAVVAKTEVEVYLNWGWYSMPVQYIYAPDGRKILVEKKDVEAYVKVGWYTVPVTAMYSLDGRVLVVYDYEVESYKSVGWFTEPVTFMFNSKGESLLIYRSAYQKFIDAKWMELPTLYSDKIREYAKAVNMDEEVFNKKYPDDSSINTLMVKYTKQYGDSIKYTLYDVDGNGVYELIFSKEDKLIDIYTISGGTLIKLYENCYFGDRSRLHILSGGYLLSEGSNGAHTSSYKLHKISAGGGALVKVSFAYYDGYGQQSYMKGFDYLTQKKFTENLDGYLKKSVNDTFKWNVLFD